MVGTALQLENVRKPHFGMHGRPELLLYSSSQTSGSSNAHCLEHTCEYWRIQPSSRAAWGSRFKLW